MGNVFKRLFNDDTFSLVEDSENETDQETLEKGENESLDKISLTDENRETIRTPTPIPTYASLKDIMTESLINNNHVEKHPTIATGLLVGNAKPRLAFMLERRFQRQRFQPRC